MLAKPLEASLEIIGRKCEVAVEFDQVFPAGLLNRGQPVIERLDYTSARLPKATIASVNNANPTVLSGSRVGNRSGVVSGAIIDNEPLGEEGESLATRDSIVVEKFACSFRTGVTTMYRGD